MRRLAAGLLACALWAPGVLPIVRAAVDACMCAPVSCCCGPQKSRGSHGGCHETRQPRGPVLRCAHASDSVDLPQTADFLLPETTASVIVPSSAAASIADIQPRDGFHRHESPPPRTLRHV
jgi:hypothetical protein